MPGLKGKLRGRDCAQIRAFDYSIETVERDCHGGGTRWPNKSDTMKRTRKTTKRTLAIHIAIPSTPQKPKMPATIATMRNRSVHRNMILILSTWRNSQKN